MEVWPKNWEALQLFASLHQWSFAVGMGGGGCLGLRYEAVYPLLDRVSDGYKAAWSRLFADVQAMEYAVLMTPSRQA